MRNFLYMNVFIEEDGTFKEMNIDLYFVDIQTLSYEVKNKYLYKKECIISPNSGYYNLGVKMIGGEEKILFRGFNIEVDELKNKCDSVTYRQGLYPIDFTQVESIFIVKEHGDFTKYHVTLFADSRKTYKDAYFISSSLLSTQKYNKGRFQLNKFFIEKIREACIAQGIEVSSILSSYGVGHDFHYYFYKGAEKSKSSRSIRMSDFFYNGQDLVILNDGKNQYNIRDVICNDYIVNIDYDEYLKYKEELTKLAGKMTMLYKFSVSKSASELNKPDLLKINQYLSEIIYRIGGLDIKIKAQKEADTLTQYVREAKDYLNIAILEAKEFVEREENEQI